MPSNSLALAVAVVVGGQVLYHAIARGADTSRSAFELVAVAYVVGLTAVLAVGLASGQIRMSRSLEAATLWRGACLGAAVALVELGYVYAYRRGLSITTGAISVLAITTVALVPIGLLGFSEQINGRVIVGVLLVLIGIWLIRS